MQLARFPRVRLAHLPTPLEAMPNLGRLLGGPTLYVKRDDCTGLATGGNKTRKLEFLMAEALQCGADTVVTQGATQSNHVRQTAAAACRLGLTCEVLLERRVTTMGPGYETTGNVLLDELFGARHEFRPAGGDMNAEAEALANAISARGGRPYVIPGGGSNPVGALGYVQCALELVSQATDTGIPIDWVVHATGSTGTQAGLVAGLQAINSGIRVMGISVKAPRAEQEANVYRLLERVNQHLGAPSVAPGAVMVNSDYVGPGYGQPTPEMVEAVTLVARHEGLLLDPVYSGKGMAGLIGLVRQGFFEPGQNVVFLHTGGSAALFAYESLFVG